VVLGEVDQALLLARVLVKLAVLAAHLAVVVVVAVRQLEILLEQVVMVVLAVR
jgi:hypothetical protein